MNSTNECSSVSTLLALTTTTLLLALAFALRRIRSQRLHILRQGRALREERAERARLAARVGLLEKREGLRQRQALHMTVGHTVVDEAWRNS